MIFMRLARWPGFVRGTALLKKYVGQLAPPGLFVRRFSIGWVRLNGHSEHLLCTHGALTYACLDDVPQLKFVLYRTDEAKEERLSSQQLGAAK